MNKKIILSILIATFIFCFIGLPFTNWWFNGDDFGILAIGKNSQTFESFFHHLTIGLTRYFTPSNYLNHVPWGQKIQYSISFTKAYFRPFFCAIISLLYRCFELNAYHYYLFCTFFHALNTAIIYF